MNLLRLDAFTPKKHIFVENLSSATVEQIERGILEVIDGKDSKMIWTFESGARILLPRDVVLRTTFSFIPQD